MPPTCRSRHRWPRPPGWSGFYAGGNAGAAWTGANVATTNIPDPVAGGIFGLAANVAAVNAAGTGSLGHGAFFTGGLQAGYNWQVSPRGLLGVEADLNSLSQRSTLSNVAATTIGAFPVTTTLSSDWLATFRGRAGVVSNNILLYMTAGAAMTRLTLAQSVNAPAVLGGTAGTSESGATKWAPVVGGGLEYLVGHRWSLKAEYLFTRFGGLETTTRAVSSGGATQILTATTDHFDVHIVRFGANYHF